jgi:D-alanyl-D-alanine carboxypeptidase
MQLHRALRTGLLCLAFQLAAMTHGAAQKTPEERRSANYAALVVNADNGKVYYGRNADKARYPASTTKMMTAYLTFEAIEKGRLKLTDRVRVSKNAAGQAYPLGLRAGTTITVRQAIEAMLIPSSNDAAVVLAEKISGSVPAFAAKMTQTAKRLGMTHTNFRNPSGLPNKAQLTTLKDMSKLAVALLEDFPQHYHFFGQEMFFYKTFKRTEHGNHNRLLGKYEGMDGFKTGYFSSAGFNLVASAKRGNDRMIAIVFGGASKEQRNADIIKLLDFGFLKLKDSTLTFPMPQKLYDSLRKQWLQPKNSAPLPSVDSTILVPEPLPVDTVEKSSPTDTLKKIAPVDTLPPRRDTPFLNRSFHPFLQRNGF